MMINICLFPTFCLLHLMVSISCQQFLMEPAVQDSISRYQQQQQQRQYNDIGMKLKFIDLFTNNPLQAVTSPASVSATSLPGSNTACLAGFMGPNKMQYIDAVGKPGSGLLLGNIAWYGSYDGCMEIPDAHYCSMRNVALNVTRIMPLSLLGVCAPKHCSVDDVTTILTMAAKVANAAAQKYLNSTVIIIHKNELTPSHCENIDRDYTTGAKIMLVILSLLICLCFFGTAAEMLEDYRKEHCPEIPYANQSNDINQQEILIDSVDGKVLSQSTGDALVTEPAEGKVVSMHEVEVQRKGNKLVNFLLCFSIIKNTKKLFDTKIPRGSITCINGIRSISITWVILGHLIGSALTGDNPAYVFTHWLKRFSLQGISNAFVSVDTFFILSGFLVSYLSLKRFEGYGKLPLIRYYVHRYIRLTPSYAFLIFFVTYVYPYFSNGPNWPEDPEKGCHKYWWTNLLYINNIYPIQHDALQNTGCYGVSWYLANDMQFYVISPIILWCMYKFKWIGVIAGSAPFFLEYILANGLIVGLNNESPIFLTKTGFAFGGAESPASKYFKDVYFKPWTRFAPYLVGMILGFIMFYQKPAKTGLSTIVFYMCGWLAAIGIGMAVVYGPYSAVNDHEWSSAETISYAIFFRIAWAIALSWLIYACHNGYGGLINDFLSWKAFIPLSRLTYGVYLIHMYIIQLYTGSNQTPLHTTEISLSFVFIPVIVISYILAYFVAVLIEYPVFNLEKLFLKF